MKKNLTPLSFFFAISSTTLSAPSGPTLNDLLAFNCPPDQPFKCLPYGMCCRGSEFCHSGLCESCFPLDVQESAWLDWCRERGQFDVSLMRNSGCRLACQDVFNSTLLAHNESTAFGYLENSSPPAAGRKNEVMEDKEIHIKLWIILVVSICLVLSLSLNACLIRRMWVNLNLSKTSVNSILKKRIEEEGNEFECSKYPNSKDASKAPLDKENGQKYLEIEDKDAANKKESRHSFSKQQKLMGAQLPNSQSTFAVDETFIHLIPADVDIHCEELTTVSASLVNGMNARDHSLETTSSLPQLNSLSHDAGAGTQRRKQKLPQQIGGSPKKPLLSKSSESVITAKGQQDMIIGLPTTKTINCTELGYQNDNPQGQRRRNTSDV